jgi:hypothetical protein
MGRVLEKEKEKVEGWDVGLDAGNGLDRFCFFSLFPFFQILFKPISNLFHSNLLLLFKFKFSHKFLQLF